MERELILASASPRRSELLAMTGMRFKVYPADVDETLLQGWTETEAVMELAVRKAKSVAPVFPDSIILSADTMVFCSGELLGKPIDEKDAVRMLKALSGKEHEVLTGLCLLDTEKNRSVVCFEQTKVRFRDLAEEDIAYYLLSGEPFDKAGAYAIQGKASMFIESIQGCYFNIVGLPLFRLGQALQELGVRWTDLVRN